MIIVHYIEICQGTKKRSVTIEAMIRNRLSTNMGIKRVRIAELRALTGLSYNTISNLYYDKTKGVDFETLDKICWALECNTQELFQYYSD